MSRPASTGPGRLTLAPCWQADPVTRDTEGRPRLRALFTSLVSLLERLATTRTPVPRGG
jgi:hypothetical protein